MNLRALFAVSTLCCFISAAALAEDLPFAGASGDYGGIIEDTTGTAPDNSGIVAVGLTERGSFSAKLVWQEQEYSFKGTFDASAHFTKSDLVKKSPTSTGTTLTVSFTLTVDTLTIDGTLTDPDGGGSVVANFQLSGQPPDPAVTAELDPGLRMAFIDPTATTARPESLPEQGSAAPTEVTEDGFALITVGKTARRSSRFAGQLPDTQKYSAGSPLRGAQYALRSGLYKQQRKLGFGGQLLGNGNVSAPSGAIRESDQAPRTIGGSAAALIAALRWHKRPGVVGTNAYPSGISQRVNLDTIPYTGSRNFRFALTGDSTNGYSNGSVSVRRGNLVAPDHDPISVKLNITIFGAKIVGPNPYGLKLKVSGTTARFSGSFSHPDTHETIKFAGSFRSFIGLVPGEGRGNFLSAPVRDDPSQSKSGSVRISVD